MTLESPNTPNTGARFTLNAGFNPVVLGKLRLNGHNTPQMGVRFAVNAPLPRSNGAGALDTTRDSG
ncbi:MAG: hypothetical protein KME52_22810 [Desmonostoc geniculatum HA4340-LM1]|nr:hypothetical protein [Desmonostoc geniculatum HA4340-LM1]